MDPPKQQLACLPAAKQRTNNYYCSFIYELLYVKFMIQILHIDTILFTVRRLFTRLVSRHLRMALCKYSTYSKGFTWLVPVVFPFALKYICPNGRTGPARHGHAWARPDKVVSRDGTPVIRPVLV